jgi:ATP/maltotriose-dependent transcriptional regulator MalT
VQHPLVRELLARLLEQERPSEYRELLHARIATALDASGRGAEAVEHWLEVPDEAAAAVARHGAAVVDTAPATVARWLARIDGPARQAPELQLLEGRLAVGDGRLLDAPGPLRHAVLGFEARLDEVSAWGARLALADALGMLERFEAALPLASGFERSLAPAAPMVAVTVAAALAGTGAYDEAVTLFERAVETRRGAPFAPFAAAFRAGWVDVQRGELDAALARVRGAAAALRREDPFRRLAQVLLIEAIVLEERGEDAEALATAAEAHSIGEHVAPGGAASDLGRRFTAGVLARRGRPDEAEAVLATLDGPGTGWYPGDLNVTRALIAAARGDRPLAVEEARRAVDAGALGTWRTRARTVARLAPMLAASGEPAWARELVGSALTAAPPQASVARLEALYDELS